MFQLLTAYLFQNKSLYIPGTGDFFVEQQNAVTDVAAGMIEAPGWKIDFLPVGETSVTAHNEPLYDWLTNQLNISKEEAVLKFDDFCDRVSADLRNHKKVDWVGLGTLEKTDGKVSFIPEVSVVKSFTGVKAKKVIRENASHQMLVGENETTTQAMREALSRQPKRGFNRNKIAWVLAGLTVALLLIYFLQKGCSAGSIGNQNKVPVEKPAETYQIR
ncbi:MAG: hypothetical protein ACK5NK_07020 [Niabella sp.]